MTFNRTPETIALNAQLRIKSLKGLYFNTPRGLCRFSSGFALEIPGKGFVRFKHDAPGVPYTPCKKALQSIINDGGFIEYDSLAFVQPLNESVA